jgi:hypothetical protein
VAIIIDRSKWLRPPVQEIVADAGYASYAVYRPRAAAHRGVCFAATVRLESQADRPPACAAIVGGVDARSTGSRKGGRDRRSPRRGAARARSRGTAKLQIPLLLAAVAINLRRLTTRLPTDAVSTEAGRFTRLRERQHTRPRTARDPARLAYACAADKPTTSTAGS